MDNKRGDRGVLCILVWLRETINSVQNFRGEGEGEVVKVPFTIHDTLIKSPKKATESTASNPIFIPNWNTLPLSICHQLFDVTKNCHPLPIIFQNDCEHTLTAHIAQQALKALGTFSTLVLPLAPHGNSVKDYGFLYLGLLFLRTKSNFLGN